MPTATVKTNGTVQVIQLCTNMINYNIQLIELEMTITGEDVSSQPSIVYMILYEPYNTTCTKDSNTSPLLEDSYQEQDVGH